MSIKLGMGHACKNLISACNSSVNGNDILIDCQLSMSSLEGILRDTESITTLHDHVVRHAFKNMKTERVRRSA
jgi:hypothetical protein